MQNSHAQILVPKVDSANALRLSANIAMLGIFRASAREASTATMCTARELLEVRSWCSCTSQDHSAVRTSSAVWILFVHMVITASMVVGCAYRSVAISPTRTIWTLKPRRECTRTEVRSGYHPILKRRAERRKHALHLLLAVLYRYISFHIYLREALLLPTTVHCTPSAPTSYSLEHLQGTLLPPVQVPHPHQYPPTYPTLSPHQAYKNAANPT